MSESNNNFLAKIKLESEELVEKFNDDSNVNCFNVELNDNSQSYDQFDSALVECIDSNEKVLENINNFIKSKKDKTNRKNLINLCGIIDPVSENDGCARSNSIYVAKYGNSHIKKSKIINPYGALSQMYQQEVINMQKKKLIEFTNSYVKRLDVNQLRKNQSFNGVG